MGSVSRGVVRGSKCADLVVRRSQRIRTLVVGVDGSEAAKRALAFVGRLAPPQRGRLTLVSTVGSLPAPSRGSVPGAAEAVTFKRILCPLDFSPPALQALGFALDLARQAGGLVTLVHAIEWLPDEEPQASAHFNVPEYRRYMVGDAHERLRTLVAEESQWVEIDDVVVFGRADREVLRAAETKAASVFQP